MSVHGDSYRYEPPFRAHLLSLLGDRLGTAGLRERHRRCAEALLEEEAYPEVARSLARAGDWPDLQLLLAEHGTAVVRPPVADLVELVPPAQRADEPWLVYAEADDRRNNARLPAARDRFRRAAAMFEARGGTGDDAGVRATARRLREIESLLAETLPSKGMYWTGWLRVAVGPHAVRDTRRVTELAPAEAELIRLVGAVYGGGVPEEITRETHAVGIDARDSPVALLGLRLVRTCIAAGRGSASPAALERIADEAEVQGLGWVARLALGSRALGGAPYTAVDTYAVASACRQTGDRWGFCCSARWARSARCVTAGSTRTGWPRCAPRPPTWAPSRSPAGRSRSGCSPGPGGTRPAPPGTRGQRSTGPRRPAWWVPPRPAWWRWPSPTRCAGPSCCGRPPTGPPRAGCRRRW
jgi:hypothetical protein